jgi:hypothetical protein
MNRLSYLFVLYLLMCFGCAAAESTRSWIIGEFDATLLPEISGLAVWNNDTLLVINDSGTEPILHVTAKDGTYLRGIKLPGVANVDWEDIATIGNAVIIADIGDNAAKRPFVTLYTILEPTSMNPRVTVQHVAYPNGARDAECILADPLTGDVFIVSKREQRCGIYRLPKPSGQPIDTLIFCGTIPHFCITSGTVAADARFVLLKTYTHIFRFDRLNDEPLSKTLLRTPITIPYTPEPQGESMCMFAGGMVVTTTEREDGGRQVPLLCHGPIDDVAIRAKAIPLVVVALQRHNNNINVSYTLPAATSVSITLVNEIGATVRILQEPTQEQGAQVHQFALPKGLHGIHAVHVRYGSTHTATTLTL